MSRDIEPGQWPSSHVTVPPRFTSPTGGTWCRSQSRDSSGPVLVRSRGSCSSAVRHPLRIFSFIW